MKYTISLDEAKDIILEESQPYYGCHAYKEREAFGIARECIDRCIPKKPKFYDYMYKGLFSKVKTYICPTCGNVCLTKMMNDRQNTSYCWDCGQALSWEDVE